jgi:hypothetical protein
MPTSTRRAAHREIALAVTERRAFYGLSQIEAAEWCGLGVETYRSIEDLTGQSKARVETLKGIATGLHFELRELLELQAGEQVELSPPEPLTVEELELAEHIRVLRDLPVEHRRHIYLIAHDIREALPG